MTNTNTTRTKVSKSSPAIKALIAATFPQWKGRKVTVIEAAPGWYSTQYIDDSSRVAYYSLKTRGVTWAERPTYGGSPVTHRAVEGVILVMMWRNGGQGSAVEIIVPATDTAAQTVIVDAMIERQPSCLVAGLACRMLGDNRTSGDDQWGSYDRGFERVTLLDVYFAALEGRYAEIVKAERKSTAEQVAS